MRGVIVRADGLGDIEGRRIAIKFLHETADILVGLPIDDDGDDHWHVFEGEPDEDRARYERVQSQVMLLSDLVGSVIPPELLNGLLPFDFEDPDIRAAYRLLVSHDLDITQARAAASHPDVVGVLEWILGFLQIGVEHYIPPGDPTRWFGLLWERRRRLIAADMLCSLANRMAQSGTSGWEAFAEANRAVDRAHESIVGHLSADGAIPPVGVPSYVPTPRGRLLADETERTVALEDDAIAERVVDLVEVADRRVLMAVPWIRSSALTSRFVNSCKDRVAHGVRVKLVTRPIKSTTTYALAAADERTVKRALATAGVDIAWNRRLHDKLFVIDDTVICGSLNFTVSDMAHNPNSRHRHDRGRCR
jgi:hypothetical protein